MHTRYLSKKAKLKIAARYLLGLLACCVVFGLWANASNDDFNDQMKASAEVRENVRSIKEQLIEEHRTDELKQYVLAVRAEEMTGFSGVKKER